VKATDRNQVEVLMGRTLRNVAASTLCVIALALSTGVTALAAETMQNPTTGHNGAPAIGCGSGSATVTPGNSVNSPGSPFNPNVTKFYAGNRGSASLANANSMAAVSQYDVACLRLTSH
jgi:hypothetical protein